MRINWIISNHANIPQYLHHSISCSKNEIVKNFEKSYIELLKTEMADECFDFMRSTKEFEQIII